MSNCSPGRTARLLSRFFVRSALENALSICLRRKQSAQTFSVLCYRRVWKTFFGLFVFQESVLLFPVVLWYNGFWKGVVFNSYKADKASKRDKACKKET